MHRDDVAPFIVDVKLCTSLKLHFLVRARCTVTIAVHHTYMPEHLRPSMYKRRRLPSYAASTLYRLCLIAVLRALGGFMINQPSHSSMLLCFTKQSSGCCVPTTSLPHQYTSTPYKCEIPTIRSRGSPKQHTVPNGTMPTSELMVASSY